MVGICITNIDKAKLKTGLKTIGILKNAQLTSYIKLVIFVLAKLKFIHSRINLMLKNNDKAKAKTLSVYKNSIFFFIYDIRTIDPGKFSNPGICNRNNFWPKTKITAELQIYLYNFKTKKQMKNLEYFFKPIKLYKLQDIKIISQSTSKKR